MAFLWAGVACIGRERPKYGIRDALMLTTVVALLVIAFRLQGQLYWVVFLNFVTAWLILYMIYRAVQNTRELANLKLRTST